MQHPLTILIPTHGRPTLLKRTLESLKACELPSTYHELVVIENGSRDGAEKLVADLPEHLNARYMHRECGNKSYALNKALKTIDDGLVVFFDDDVRVDPRTLEAYARAASDHDGGVFFGGPVEVDREEDPPEWIAPRFPSSVLGFDLVGRRMAENKFVGFNWATFAEDVKQLGGFDPRFGPGSPSGATGQEGDMQDRMLSSGSQGIDVMNAKVAHHVPAQNVTLRWLLNRRIRDGVGRGIRLAKMGTPAFIAYIFRESLTGIGVLVKGLAFRDGERVSIALCHLFWLRGIVKGYRWQRQHRES